MKKWLVEITTKVTDYFAKDTIHLMYLEIEAEDEYYARHKAVSDYENMLKHCPKVRKEFIKICNSKDGYCAAQAVEI